MFLLAASVFTAFWIANRSPDAPFSLGGAAEVLGLGGLGSLVGLDGGPANHSRASESGDANTAAADRPLIVPDVPRDAIPPLDSPAYVSVSQAGRDLTNDDFVLVTLFDDEVFAYPERIMNWHEIVNDHTSQGTPFAATFCPLCRSGIVFDRRLEDGTVIEFGNTGSLYESAMVMYDRQTNSDWAHVEGVAIRGSLRGTKLTVLPSGMITFGQLRRDHPQAKVLSFDTGHDRPYDRNPFAGYEDADGAIPFPLSKRDERLPLKTRVLGLEFNGQAKAYPITVESPSEFQDELVGGQAVRVEFNLADASAVAVDPATGDPLPQLNTFWFGWSVSHPDTQIAEY